MFFYLLLLFTALPLVEFALLYWLGVNIGLLQTILLVLGTGALGAALARQQGLATLWRVRQEMAAGKMPGDALFDGALILVAGAVLITPGVLTDAVGFALLIPPLRAVIKQFLRKHFASSVTMHVSGAASGPTNAGGQPAGRGEVIDVEVVQTRVEDA